MAKIYTELCLDSKSSLTGRLYEQSLSDGVDLFASLKADSTLPQLGLYAVSYDFARQWLSTKQLYQLPLDTAVDFGS